MARFLGIDNGQDGAIDLGSYGPEWFSCSGTSGVKTLSATGTFSAGDRIFIHQSRGTNVGSYEDNTVASYTPGTLTLQHNLENTYSDSGSNQAQVGIVKRASSVTGTITIPKWDGNVGGIFIICANTSFAGTVDASGAGYNGGRTGYISDHPGTHTGGTGEGFSASSIPGSLGSDPGNDYISPVNNGVSGGGGGGMGARASDRSAGGGGGGYATPGIAGTYVSNETPLVSGGSAGTTYGTSDLSKIYFGAGGGGGGKGKDGTEEFYGGAGGGIIIIYTSNLTSSALLNANGGLGADTNTIRITDVGPQAASGGGAGGSILVKAKTATLGTGKIVAGGGKGGNAIGIAGHLDGAGGNGGSGRIRIETCSVSGAGTPTPSFSTGGHPFCGGGLYIF